MTSSSNSVFSLVFRCRRIDYRWRPHRHLLWLRRFTPFTPGSGNYLMRSICPMKRQFGKWHNPPGDQLISTHISAWNRSKKQRSLNRKQISTPTAIESCHLLRRLQLNINKPNDTSNKIPLIEYLMRVARCASWASFISAKCRSNVINLSATWPPLYGTLINFPSLLIS